MSIHWSCAKKRRRSCASHLWIIWFSRIILKCNITRLGFYTIIYFTNWISSMSLEIHILNELLIKVFRMPWIVVNFKFNAWEYISGNPILYEFLMLQCHEGVELTYLVFWLTQKIIIPFMVFLKLHMNVYLLRLHVIR